MYILLYDIYCLLQVQVICDNSKKIRDVFVGYPGSVHDARVFRTSPIGQNLAEKCRDYVLLGDSAYPCLRNLLTPFKDNGNLTNVQKKYNKKLSHCRVFIEHTIGLLKQRFRQLYHLKSRKIEFICHFVRACCVLHNMCMEDIIFKELQENQNEENIGNEADDDENDERNEIGVNYRNYIAAILDI